jgi:hypothetical protein
VVGIAIGAIDPNYLRHQQHLKWISSKRFWVMPDDLAQPQIMDRGVRSDPWRERLLHANLLISMLGLTAIWLYHLAKGFWTTAGWLISLLLQ